jgi:hypothetical protein
LTLDTTIPKYLLVEDHIRQQIKQRKITDRLPGERVLAKELGRSPLQGSHQGHLCRRPEGTKAENQNHRLLS